MTTSTEDLRTHASHLTEPADLRRQVEEIVNTTPVVDMHTHLFAPQFGQMSLFGIDELLAYHYLIAEMFRSSSVAPERFWQMNKAQQSDLIWKTLFVENTPLSEATRGVITVLDAFGLDTRAPDLVEARAFFQSRNPLEHLDSVLEEARVSSIVMTNDPFDEREAQVWERGAVPDSRFHASLRIDPLLNDWYNTVAKLSSMGYQVDVGMHGGTEAEVRRFLDRWIERMRPVYIVVSLPDDFRFPADDSRDWLIREVVLPTARQHGLPFGVMVGVRRGVNPALRAGGDGMGQADMKAIERMCAENPDIRFLATFLSRANQHELCVAARKFSNLMPFGCWWFLNNPSLVEEITRERIEMLGTSFIPQHSDARILEQLIYKWRHSRSVIAECLCEAYEKLLASGRAVTREEIVRDVALMFSGNFRKWVG